MADLEDRMNQATLEWTSDSPDPVLSDKTKKYPNFARPGIPLE